MTCHVLQLCQEEHELSALVSLETIEEQQFVASLLARNPGESRPSDVPQSFVMLVNVCCRNAGRLAGLVDFRSIQT